MQLITDAAVCEEMYTQDSSVWVHKQSQLKVKVKFEGVLQKKVMSRA